MEYYKSEQSVKEYIEMAKDVDSSQLIQHFSSYLPNNSKVLEIGSGPGTDYRILAKNYDVVGSDFSIEFLKHLKSENPRNIFLELNAITLNTDKIFDGIYSNKVLQHLTNIELEQSILRQSQLLSSKGIVCHSFWKGEGDEIFKGMLVNYQNSNSLQKLFETHFKIVLIQEYKEFEPNDSVFLIGVKK